MNDNANMLIENNKNTDIANTSPFKNSGRDRPTSFEKRMYPQKQYDFKYKPNLESIWPKQMTCKFSKAHLPQLFSSSSKNKENQNKADNIKYMSKTAYGTPRKYNDVDNNQNENMILQKQLQETTPVHSFQNINQQLDISEKNQLENTTNHKKNTEKIRSLTNRDFHQNNTMRQKFTLIKSNKANENEDLENLVSKEIRYNNYHLRENLIKKRNPFNFSQQQSRPNMFKTQLQKELELSNSQRGEQAIWQEKKQDDDIQTSEIVKQKYKQVLDQQLKYFKEIVAQKKKFQRVGKIVEPLEKHFIQISKSENVQLNNGDEKKICKLQINKYGIPRNFKGSNNFEDPKPPVDKNYRYRNIVQEQSNIKDLSHLLCVDEAYRNQYT